MAKKEDFGIVALSGGKYHQRPSLEVVNPSQPYISYGEDNLFPQYLISLLSSSPAHSALVTSIAAMIFGKGAVCSNEDFAKRIDLDDLTRKTAIDLKLQGGFVWEVYWSAEGNEVVNIEHTPFEQWRSGQKNEDGEVTKYYHCLDWADKQRNKVTDWNVFNPITASGSEVQIIYCKPFSVGSMYYPKPDYIGAVNWIEVDKNVSIFHNNNIQNGLHPGFSVHWKNGIPPKQQRDAIRKDIEKQISGAENAGRFWMTFSDSPEQTPEIKPFEVSSLDKQFTFISEESTDKIMIGHRVTTPALFGVKTAGQLSQASELEEAKRIFNKDVVEPYQRIINEWFEEVVKFIPDVEYIRIENDAADMTASSDQAYTGEQMRMVLELVGSVNSGQITRPQARALLQSMFGFSDAAAAEAIPEPMALSKVDAGRDISDEEGEQWAQWLADKGERMNDGYVLIHEEEVKDPVSEYSLHLSDSRKVALFQRFANPEERSEIDTGLYKIRYRYSQQLKDNSRTFCKNMVENSRGGVSYRFEDIESMDGQVNTQFAPSGEDSYSIWLWKGGCYCHHFWVRQVWMRKREGGRFLPNDGLKNDKRVSVARAEEAGVPFKDEGKDFAQAATRPIDTPNRGKLN